MKKSYVLFALLILVTFAISVQASQRAGSNAPHRIEIPSDDPSQPEYICVGTFSCSSEGSPSNFSYGGDCNMDDVLDLISIAHNTCGGTLD